MSEHDVHTLTGAYAADALPDDERREFEAHLETCATCRQEVTGLTAAAARLGVAVAGPAPEGLRERVLAEAARTRQVSPAVSDRPQRSVRTAWYREPFGVAASVLLLVALALGVLATTEARRADDAQSRAQAIAELLTSPGRHELTRPVTTGGDGTVVEADGRALFRATGLTGLPGDRTYQLWVMRADGAHSAGVLGRAPDGTLQQFLTALRPGDRLGLSVEPDGGSRRPTTDPVLLLPVRT